MSDMENASEELTNGRYSAESSLVMRYLKGSGLDLDDAERTMFREWLARASMQEGVRLLPLFTHGGVDVHLLDESTLMHTRTFKSIDGCVTAAHCKRLGFDKVVLESGGNNGTALTTYCRRLGIETFCFVPQANLPLLNSKTFAHPTSHLIAVRDRGMVKEATHRFARQRGLPLVPRVDWRYEAARFRGSFILEQIMAGRRFDWLSQTISAAFGPIGIYRVLRQHRAGIGALPRFLGVQQATNCPMYRAWQHNGGDRGGAASGEEPLVVSVMYDVRPQTHGTYAELEQLLDESVGSMTTVDAGEFDAFLQRRFNGRTPLEHLDANGISITLHDGGIVEKAGLMSLAGVVKAIDAGTIPSGSRILCSLTGGASEGDGKAMPEHCVDSVEQVDGLYLPEVSQ